MQNGIITRSFSNRHNNDYYNEEWEGAEEECINCPYNLYEKKLEHEAEVAKHHTEIEELFKKYSKSDWTEGHMEPN